MKKSLIFLSLIGIIGAVIWIKDSIMKIGMLDFVVRTFITVSILGLMGTIIYMKVNENG